MNRAGPAQSARTILILAGLALPILVASCAPRAETSWREEDLPQPGSITIDDSVGQPRARRAIRAARLLCAFWNTGKSEYVEAAVGPGFSDSTLPEGWRHGPDGLKAAWGAFHTAVPDLRCVVEHLHVTGDKVVARLAFRGTHEGDFFGHPATGKPIEFRAIDVLRVEDGRIVEDGHVEDNYNSTLMRQLGMNTRPTNGKER
jgi:predicted ester cyclase